MAAAKRAAGGPLIRAYLGEIKENIDSFGLHYIPNRLTGYDS